MRLRGRGNTRRALKARLEAKPSTFVTKVRKTPDLLQEQSVRAAPHWSSTSKVGKSASRPSSTVQRDNSAEVTQTEIPTLGGIRRCRQPTG